MEEVKKHAILSASSAHKWLVCTPSARLEEQFPNKESEYMKEGTLAHEIAEYKVRNYFLEPGSKRSQTMRINKFKKAEGFQAEMLTHTDSYLEYIKNLAMESSEKPFIAVEQQISYDNYVPEGFGTVDCILINGETLNIIDFKYGKGVPVDATENPQLKLYALGAIDQYGMLFPINKVKLHIVQPRIDNISSYELPTSDLINWGNTVVKPKAQEAFMGLGEFKQGEHCRFCKAKGACEFRAHENLQKIEKIKKDVSQKEIQGLLTNAELGDALSKTEGIIDWIKDMQEQALSLLLKGEDVLGWKAVEGRSNRKIVDVDKAFEILEANGYNQEMLYERKPLGLTALEKVVGKKELATAIGDYIEKPKGKPTLVKESDKREPYKVSAAEIFKNAESEEA